MPHPLHAIGLMSGSSLDGLDIALCRFALSEGLPLRLHQWSLLRAQTAPFSASWQRRLRTLPQASALELAQAHVDFGHYMGELIHPLLQKLSEEGSPVDLIASHGHTVFHYPSRRLTLQIGDGAALAAATGCIVIDNFRAMDVALGGQGAPLAPLADQLLFPGHDFYLNLGGIANISAGCAAPDGSTRFVAFDIGGANQVLNALVEPLGLPYDEDGKLAATGTLLPHLLQRADRLDFFRQPYPKSLGNDWVQERLLPLFLQADASTADKLHTACLQLARQVARAVDEIIHREKLAGRNFRMLITGGGAFNRFLVQAIREECKKICSFTLTIPEPDIVSFKEAALMALMGALRWMSLPNCLASATGARADAVGGGVHWGRGR